MRLNTLLAPALLLLAASAFTNDLEAEAADAYPGQFTYTTALPWEAGVTRRDPSDVILIDGTYYLWYSKVVKGPGIFKYPSGYSAEVYYATSQDGKDWTEQGIAVGKGGPGAWDGHGVFTPNILVADAEFYLFYTGVPRPFDDNTKTAIGVATASSPGGPWEKVVNPVLLPSGNPADFDSMRVDDAALLKRGNKYWLYYKGRQLDHSPGETRMGLAMAEAPAGPYTKHPANPLHPGHEVMVWPQDNGVSSMATAAGPRMIYHARDGLIFAPRQSVTGPPAAPGAFRADHFENNAPGQPLEWGICHVSKEGDLHLARFDCQYPEQSSDTAAAP